MAALLVSASVSCSEDMDYTPGGTTPVKQLLTPAVNYYAELQSSATATVNFSWSPAMAEDGTKANYEILFFKSAKDTEIAYVIDAGSNTSVNILHKDLNKAAGKAGIKTGTTGDLYWTVTSNRAGISAPIEAAPRCLTIKRLNGFEEIPAQLYLLGDGTEAGDSGLRCLESGADGGEFSVYSQLEAGKKYFFVSTMDAGATPRTFAIDANGVIAETAEAGTVAESGIYRIYLDFNTRAYTMNRIDKIQLFQCSQNKSFADFKYQGRGVWSAAGLTTQTGDDRYLFHTWTNGSGNWNEKWASKNWDNAGAPSLGSPGDFWAITIQTDRLGDAWGYSFKWISSEWAKKTTVDVTIVMNLDDYANKPYFYHVVSYK